MKLGAAGELGIDADQVRVPTAGAPIVGRARVASVTGNMVRALALELEGGRGRAGRMSALRRCVPASGCVV
jgi:hypothetical protein